jgi:hypothetical protein
MSEKIKSAKLLKALDNPNEKLSLDKDLTLLYNLGEKLKKEKAQVTPIVEDTKFKLQKKILNLYQLTKKPMDQKIFTNQDLLPKKKRPFWKRWYFAAGVAGMVILIIVGVAALISNNKDNSNVVANDQLKEEKTEALTTTLTIDRGKVEVKTELGWKEAKDGAILGEGNSIRTGEKSRVALNLSDGSAMRLDQNTEVKLVALSRDKVTIEQPNGLTYHRVNKETGLTYEVESGGVRARALGTAFSFDRKEKEVKNKVIESKVKVTAKNLEEEIPSGKECIINLEKEGDEAIKVDDINKEELKDEFYTWNKEKDQEENRDLGVFAEVKSPKLEISQPQNGVEVDTETITVKGLIDADAKVKVNGIEVENKEGLFRKEIKLTEGSNSIKVVVWDEFQNTTEKSITVTYKKKEDEYSVNLSAKAESDGTRLTWGFAGDTDFDGFKMVRSETNPNPTYPGEWYQYLSGTGARSYTDSSTTKDHNYYYRVGIYKGGKVVAYSNNVQIKAVNGEKTSSGTYKISLSGKAQSDGVHLSWSIAGDTNYSGFKVVRSKTNTNPSYPADYLQYVEAKTKSYTDTKTTKDHSYYYRVGIYKDGNVVAYSNSINVKATNGKTTENYNISLSGTAQTDGVHLSWSVTGGSNYDGYKVVRSETNQNPAYPSDTLQFVSGASTKSYNDGSAAEGKSYYCRVGVYKDGQVVKYSNSIRVTAK